MTMDVQTVFIGALMLCKPGVVDEIIPDLELDLFRPELRDAFAAVQGYWTARGKIDIVEINTQHPDVAQTLLACVQTCESECVRIDREQMQRWAQLIRERAALTRVQGLAFQMTSELTDYSDLSDIYQQMGEAMSLKTEEEDAWTYEDVLNDYGWSTRKAEKESRWAIQWWQAKIVKQPDDDWKPLDAYISEYLKDYYRVNGSYDALYYVQTQL